MSSQHMLRFPDRIELSEDTSAAGAAEPSYTARFQWVPAHIRQISGDETYRGRQLEGHIDWVVSIRRLPVDNTWRARVKTGVCLDRNLNIEWVRELMQENGKPPMQELLCTEVQP